MFTTTATAWSRSGAGGDHRLRQALVLGLGNDLLSDDAIGLRLARVLRARLASLELDVVETTEMGLALLDHLTGYRQVWILDAVQTGRAPAGTLHAWDSGCLQALAGGSPHFLGVGETLALGRHLGLPMPGRIAVFAVEVSDPFTLDTRMSPALERALPELAEQIAVRIEAELNRASSLKDA